MKLVRKRHKKPSNSLDDRQTYQREGVVLHTDDSNQISISGYSCIKNVRVSQTDRWKE